MAFDECKECRRLWNGHDGSKRQWITVCVMTVRDSADGMAKYFDGRLRNVLVIVGRARLAEILQVPWDLLASFDVQFRTNASELAESDKRCIGPTTSSAKHRIIGFWRLRHDVPNVFVDDSVHRTVERLASLDSPKINPSPSA
jgi:hypothetical protein